MAVQNKMVPGVAPEDDPQYNVPTEHVGKLEPNYFCRAWNPRSEKYCRARSGQGTDHPGQGRCRVHGGNIPIVHGRYSNVVRGELAEIIDDLEAETDEEKFNLLPEATLARAVAMRFVEKFDANIEAIRHWNEVEYITAKAEGRSPKPIKIPEIENVIAALEKTANIVDRAIRHKYMEAIPKSEFQRVMKYMGAAVESRVREFEEQKRLTIQDADLLIKKIREDWRTTRVRRQQR